MTASHPRMTRGESMHVQIARQIRNDIEAGVLRHGEALRSSRELADEWGVSVFTVSEAMKLLVDEGLVVSKSRSKRMVNAPDQAHRNKIRLPQPRVVLIGGYAGSGKTELGRILARKTGWPMLDKDTLTRPVVEAALEILGRSPHDRDSETYLNAIRPREYEALQAATHENIECGNSAIVTAPFIREFNDPAWLKRTLADNTARQAITTVVWVYCDAETMHTYIRRRGAARDAVKLNNWPAYLKSIDVDFRPPVPHVVIDNRPSSPPLQDQATELFANVLSEEPA